MLLDSLGELEDKRPWSTGAQSRRSCHRRSCAACFEQLAGVFASCGDRHIINYLPGSLSSEENLQMYRNDYSDNEPDIPGCQRRSVPVRSGASQFAPWSTAADRPRHVILSQMFLDSLGELENKRPSSTGAQSRRSCRRRSCAACFEQLAGVFASCGDR